MNDPHFPAQRQLDGEPLARRLIFALDLDFFRLDRDFLLARGELDEELLARRELNGALLARRELVDALLLAR